MELVKNRMLRRLLPARAGECTLVPVVQQKQEEQPAALFRGGKTGPEATANATTSWHRSCTPAGIPLKKEGNQ
jgi:hypothetical protein